MESKQNKEIDLTAELRADAVMSGQVIMNRKERRAYLHDVSKMLASCLRLKRDYDKWFNSLGDSYKELLSRGQGESKHQEKYYRMLSLDRYIINALRERRKVTRQDGMPKEIENL